MGGRAPTPCWLSYAALLLTPSMTRHRHSPNKQKQKRLCSTPGCSLIEYHQGLCSHLALHTNKRTRPLLRNTPINTPDCGENVHNLQTGDACLFQPYKNKKPTRVELLSTGTKPVIVITHETLGTRSLPTSWNKLSPILNRGEMCWYNVMEKHSNRRRLLVILQKTIPKPMICPVDEDGISCSGREIDVAWADLEALSEFEIQLMNALRIRQRAHDFIRLAKLATGDICRLTALEFVEYHTCAWKKISAVESRRDINLSKRAIGQ